MTDLEALRAAAKAAPKDANALMALADKLEDLSEGPEDGLAVEASIWRFKADAILAARRELAQAEERTAQVERELLPSLKEALLAENRPHLKALAATVAASLRLERLWKGIQGCAVSGPETHRLFMACASAGMIEVISGRNDYRLGDLLVQPFSAEPWDAEKALFVSQATKLDLYATWSDSLGALRKLKANKRDLLDDEPASETAG